MPTQLTLFDLPPMEGPIVTFRPVRFPIWFENKAKLIERYLHYFVMITKHGAYIDGFASPPHLLTAVQFWYHRHEFEGYLGNVG